MSSTNHKATLKQWLDAEIEQAQRLHTALEQEYLALTERKADLLEKATTAKHACADQCGSIAQQRDVYLKSLGLPEGKPGLEALLAHFKEPILNKAWDTLLDLARENRRLNRINGGIIELSQQHIGRALALFQGGQTPSVSLYGTDGRTGSRRSGISLAVA